VWLRNVNWALLAAVMSGPLATRCPAQDGPVAESLTKNLQAADVTVRREAAIRIRLSGRNVQRQALAAMIDVLKKEKDGQVRLAVLDSFTALGHDAASAVPALVQTFHSDLGGDEQEKRHQDYRSALALAAVGKPAVEGLRALLKERKESVRAEAAMALGRIGPDAEAAVPDLLALLPSTSEPIGREAALALGRIGGAAVEPLIAALARNAAIERSRAALALGHLSAPGEEARLAVLTCAQDSSPEVRAAALASLARFKLPDDALLPLARENVRHEDERVRLAVLNLLVERRALLLRLAPELESLLTAKHDGVARHAAYLLGKSGPESARRLLSALRENTSRIDQIAEALALLGRPVAPSLAQALHSPEPRVRQGAALALGQVRPVPSGTAVKLAAGLTDPIPGVKTACLTAIGYLGPRAGDAVPAVRAMLKDESAEIRVKAIAILPQSAPRDQRLLGDLRALLDDPDARVERQAIDAIRTLGALGRGALPEVIRKLNGKSPEIRLAALELVGSHGESAAEAVPALCSLLDDPEPKLQTIAAQTLAKLGKAAQPALGRLSSLLAARQVELREAAATALGSLELDAEVIRPHLGRALRDDKPEVRRAAMRSIQRFGPQGTIFVPDIILLAEKNENRRIVERMLRRFERTGPDVRSVPELVNQLGHKQDGVRLLAIKFLGLAGAKAKQAIPALERMAKDPSAEVRRQAREASERIKKQEKPARQA
jgi:HEAT repeat protein